MKIGIYAGTFDPIHNGHLAFARQALEQGLDMVYFLPEPRPRRKQGVRALEHREGMIDAAIRDDARLGLIKLEQARFTVHETLPVLEQRFPGADLVFLFGDDVVKHLADWPHVTDLALRVRLLVALRREKYQVLEQTFRTLESVTGRMFRYELITSKEPSLSSSLVRRELKARTLTTGAPPQVVSYIREHRLYR